MTGPSSASLPASRPRLVWWHAAVIILACITIYFVGLSWRSFASSEGHRVGPAWEMLDRGDPWRITLFGQTYFRKPPGMPWAIAAASSWLGRDEFAARSVSALASTLSALACWWFASRWFGPRFGLAAGLALATMPQLWSPGRTAEIEALNNFGTLLAALAIIDRILAIARPAAPAVSSLPTAGVPVDPGVAGRIGPAAETSPVSPPRGAIALIDHISMLLFGALGIVIAALAKGPASVPVLAGVLLAALVMRLWTRRAIVSTTAMLALAAAVLLPLARRIYAANDDPTAVTQGADAFLWSKGAPGALLLIPMSLVSALPASLAFAFPWGKDASAETASRADAARALRTARLLAWAWLLSLAVYLVIGVGNPRYAMPAAGLLAPLVGYVMLGAWGHRAFFNTKRRHLVKRLTLGNPPAIPVILCVAAVLSTYAARRYKIGVDGREAGAAVAQISKQARGTIAPIQVWANGLIDARPDVMLYARQARPDLDPRWTPRQFAAGELPPPGSLLILRVDSDGDERPHYEQAILDSRLIAIDDGEVGRYKFRLYERVGR